MPQGEIKFVISGDASKYEKDLEQVKLKAEETKKTTALHHKEILTRDNVVSAKVMDTVHRTRTEITEVETKTRVDVEKLIAETERNLKNTLRNYVSYVENQEKAFSKKTEEDITEVVRIIRLYQNELDNLNSKVKTLEATAQQTELNVRNAISKSLMGLRAVTDIAALVSITTGEQIDVHYLAMISMGISAAMQLQTMAAVYAVTPGFQPAALMILSLLPMITGMIGFMKSEQMRVQARIDESAQKRMDSLITGVNI